MIVAARVALAAVLIGTTGCTLPQGPGGGSGAGYLGDRSSVGLDEIVVSVPSEGTPPFRNLHVGLAAIINPRDVSLYTPTEVESVVMRTQARLDARLVEVLLAAGPVRIGDLPTLRQRLAQEAQAVVDNVLAAWKHADEYQVTVVVVSLYFTDGSVGRQPTRGRTWW